MLSLLSLALIRLASRWPHDGHSKMRWDDRCRALAKFGCFSAHPHLTHTFPRERMEIMKSSSPSCWDSYSSMQNLVKLVWTCDEIRSSELPVSKNGPIVGEGEVLIVRAELSLRHAGLQSSAIDSSIHRFRLSHSSITTSRRGISHGYGRRHNNKRSCLHHETWTKAAASYSTWLEQGATYYHALKKR